MGGFLAGRNAQGSCLGIVGQTAQVSAPAVGAKTAEPAGSRPDAGTTAILTMRQLGVAPLPRNYELFYEAVTGGSKELTDALSALGSRPKQKQLDTIACRFLARDSRAVEDVHKTISSKLNEILTLLKKERHSMETYGRILGETSSGLKERRVISPEFLDKIVSVMSAATRATIENRDQIVSSINDRSCELTDARSKLEEYRRLADTDSLTQLGNRRAFDRILSGLYDETGTVFAALMIADIDHFKTVNDRFGHPVGDRVIQSVAQIIRNTVREDAFVARVGGEEFAIVVEGRGEEAAHAVAEDIRKAVMDAPFVNVANGNNYGPITLSVGLCMATDAHSAAELYARADRALYAAKAAGRNRVTRFSSLTDSNFVKNWLLYRPE